MQEVSADPTRTVSDFLSNHQSVSFIFIFFFIHFKGGGIVLVCVFVYTVMHIWRSGNNMKESVCFFHLMGPRKRTRVDKPDSKHRHPLSLRTLTALNVEVL